MSYVQGPSTPPLQYLTLGQTITQNSTLYPSNLAIRSAGQTYTFRDLDERSARVAQALLDLGIKPGEHVGILAGNRIEYIDVVLGVGRIGCVLVALNPLGGEREVNTAHIVFKQRCKAVVIASRCGSVSLHGRFQELLGRSLRKSDSDLEHVVLINDEDFKIDVSTATLGVLEYDHFLKDADVTRSSVLDVQSKVNPEDVLTLQFTSGTSGLQIVLAVADEHSGVLNNALQLGIRMGLGPADSLCCPAALFRPFGLVMSFLNAFIHGACTIFPGEQFDAEATTDAILSNSCTALVGETKIFGAMVETLERRNETASTVRTCLAAGAVVPVEVRRALREKLGVSDMVIGHGQTEIGPVLSVTSRDDPDDTFSVGRLMAHRAAKVVDSNGTIVARGTRGELWVSGYCVLKEYHRPSFEKFKDNPLVLTPDDQGVMWFHTGDEFVIDEDGYLFYKGRLADFFTIEDGTRIDPAEVEHRLVEHEGIEEACVIQVSIRGARKDRIKAVGALLKSSKSNRPSDEQVQDWVGGSLGDGKSPQIIFWTGDPGVQAEIPKTYNGKTQRQRVHWMAQDLMEQD